MSDKVTSSLKVHGGKSYLASRIVALMPPHQHYCEPFFGGGSVLFAKPYDGISEVVNDLSWQLTNFWRVLQRASAFESFKRHIEATPFSEVEFDVAQGMQVLTHYGQLPEELLVLHAIYFFIRCRQSMAGRMNSFAPLSRSRTRRGMNEQAAAWLSAIEGLPEVHNRLKRVVIFNTDAVAIIKSQDSANAFFYCDPPYLHETRSAKEVYEHEMTPAQHGLLLETLLACKGKVALSGYRSSLYDKELASWNRHDFEIANHAASGKTKRVMTECLWCNY